MISLFDSPSMQKNMNNLFTAISKFLLIFAKKDKVTLQPAVVLLPKVKQQQMQMNVGFNKFRPLVKGVLFTFSLLMMGGVWGQTIITTGVTTNASAIAVGNSITINAGGTLNMDVARSFAFLTTANSGTSTISGPGTLTISGTNGVGITQGNILALNTICNTTILRTTTDGTCTISGNGTLNASGNVVINKGNGNNIGLIVISVGVTVNAAQVEKGTGNNGSWNITVNGVLGISGSTFNNGALNTVSFNSNSTVNYNGASQTVLSGNYAALTLAGSGTKAFSGVVAVANNLSIANSVIVNLFSNNHTAATLTLNSAGAINGTWGGTSSAAILPNNNFFTGTSTGILTVSTTSCSNPAPSAGSQTKTYTGVANTTAITATAAGQTVDWYSTSTGGTPLLSGNSSYTPSTPINVGTYSFFAESRNLNTYCISSSRSTVTLTINTATLTYTANAANRSYGAANPAFSGTITGFVNSETLAIATTGTLAFTSTATAASNVGIYAINGSGLTANNGNYTFVQAAGNVTALTIGTATLTYTANAANRSYGAANPAFSGTIAGFVNSETRATALTGTLAFTSFAIAISNVGNYTITGSGLTANNGNYTFAQAAGNATALTIVKAILTITASNQSVCFGTTVNTVISNFTFTTTGFVNAITSSVISGAVTYSTNYTSSSLAGTLGLTISPVIDGLTALNYNFTVANGTILVNPILTASVSIAASPSNSICVGTNVTFTATPINGGTPSYQWKLNGNNVGTNTITYSSTTLANNDVVTVEMTSNATPCLSVSKATSTGITVSISANTWTGAGANSLWNTGENWSCGSAPLAGSIVIIASTAVSSPQLPGNLTVNNLTIETGKTFDINGNTLTINGALSGAGTLTGSHTSNLVIGAAAGTLNFTQTVTGNFLKNFTLNNAATATLGNALNITGGNAALEEGTLTVTGTGVLTTGGFLTIKSNGFGTARIAQGITTGNYISGNVTVERFIPKNTFKGWRLLGVNTSSATQTIKQAWQENQSGSTLNENLGFGTMITGIAATDLIAQGLGFDQRSQGGSMLYYVPSTDAFTRIPNTNATLLNAYPGYFLFIRGDRSAGQFGASSTATTSTTLRSTGAVYQGNQSAIAVGSGLYGLISNPYASRLDMRNITIGSGLTDAFEIWDPKLAGSYGFGAFQTFYRSGSNYLVTPGGGSYGTVISVQNFIESGSAFFVNSVSVSGNTVTINESSKASGSSVVYRPAGTLEQSANLVSQLYVKNANTNVLADGNVIEFAAAHSNEIDILDVRKNPNFGENFSLLSKGTDVSVERRALLTATDTLFYKIGGLKQLTYQFEFIPGNLAASGLEAYLEDAYKATKTALDLMNTSSYTFTVDANAASKASNRFRMVFKPLGGPLTVNFTSIKAVAQNNDIAVEWKVASQLNIANYEVEKSTNGRSFTRATVQVATGVNNATATYNWLDVNVANVINYYRIKALDINGKVSYSPIVKVTTAKLASSFTISPNPVKGNSVNLVLSKQPAGEYVVNLSNATGQTIYSNKFQHAGGNVIKTFNLSNGIVNGVYQLQIVSPNNTRNTQKLIVEGSN